MFYAQIGTSSQVRCKHDYWPMKEKFILVMMFIRGTYVRILFGLSCPNLGYSLRAVKVYMQLVQSG